MFVKFCKALGRGVAGVVVWPISTIFSVRRIWKILRDPEIPFFHITFDHEMQREFCPPPCLRRLDNTRPDNATLERMKHLSVARYRMPMNFFYKQLSTIFLNLLQLIFYIPYICSHLAYHKNTLFTLTYAGASMGSISGLLGFIFCAMYEESFSAAIDAIIMPFKSICINSPKSLLQDKVLESAILANDPRLVQRVIKNSNRAQNLKSELLNFSQKIGFFEKSLQDHTPLPEDVNNIILKYCFLPAYITMLDSQRDKPILPSLSVRFNHLEQHDHHIDQDVGTLSSEESKFDADVILDIVSEKEIFIPKSINSYGSS